MKRDALRGFLQIGIFVGLGGLLLAFAQPADSPEFVISVCGAIMGLLLIVGTALAARFMR
jgi:hypothetical protein